MPSGKAEIIAELGVAHNGSMSEAIRLVDDALSAGADWIKFQLVDPERLALQRGRPELADLPALGFEEWEAVLERIPRNKRMLTIFEPLGAVTASQLGVDVLKIGHAEEANRKLIAAVDLFSHRWGFSTTSPGLCNPNGAEFSLGVVPEYPCSLSAAENMIKKCVPLDYGYSDHTGPTLNAARLALRAGCPIIEIHVHRDNCTKCPDHVVSKTMSQLAELCKGAHAQ